MLEATHQLGVGRLIAWLIAVEEMLMNHLTATCSFCSQTESQVGRLVPGRAGIYICRQCTDQASVALLDSVANDYDVFQVALEIPVSCIFCDRSYEQVWKLLQGYGTHVCGVCIELANVILGDESVANGVNRSRAKELHQYNIPLRWSMSGVNLSTDTSVMQIADTTPEKQ